MATIIIQQPLYRSFPIGQDVIFTVSNNLIITNPLFTRPKFVADVYISNGNPPSTSSNTDLIGTFKTTPNNAGVGMFDFRPIIESFVNPDNIGAEYSKYKLGTALTVSGEHPIHLIDQFSHNKNLMRYVVVRFKVEYINTTTGLLETVQPQNSYTYQVFNGYLKHTDELVLGGLWNKSFGFNTDIFKLSDVSPAKFYTNAPMVQYANNVDYGTIAFSSEYQNIQSQINRVKIKYYPIIGGGSTEYVDFNLASGGFTPPNAQIKLKTLYFGCFPGNLRNWSTTANTYLGLNNLDYYTLGIVNSSGVIISDTLTINVKCPNLKGYEPIRLTWLNQWGAWDYYTFTMKSSKTISTKGSTYQQLEGSWNEKSYKIDSFKGGKKSFRVNATEKITMNTDFVSESESEWFEELINSPEVYILEGFQNDTVNSSLNKYVIPVRLITSNYTKKTVANDKLMQYTFEVEKSKTLRTQSV
tara:strand:- start:1127 stop:2536 length:1410 start_codon:yes stop_codon:yes gene_type:complete